MLFTLSALLGSYWTLVPLVGAYNTLYELKDVTATVYYDSGWETNGDKCSGRFGAGWAANQADVPHCEQNGPKLYDLGTNQVVAMNATWLEEDASAWCGKEVKVFKSDGSEIQFDQPLVLWDACAACVTDPRLDFGVAPYLDLDSTDCGSSATNPSGLTVKVVDNQIWAPAPGSDSYSPTSASTLYTGGGYNLGNPTNTNVPPWNTGAATGSDGGAGSAAATATVATSASGGAVTGALSTQVTGSISSSSATADGAGATSSAATTAVTSVNFQTEELLVTTTQSSLVSISAAASSALTGSSAATSISASGTGNVVALSSTGTCDTPGAQECQGLSLYICTYTTSGSDTLGWVLQNTCPSTCSADSSRLTCE